MFVVLDLFLTFQRISVCWLKFGIKKHKFSLKFFTPVEHFSTVSRKRHNTFLEIKPTCKSVFKKWLQNDIIKSNNTTVSLKTTVQTLSQIIEWFQSSVDDWGTSSSHFLQWNHRVVNILKQTAVSQIPSHVSLCVIVCLWAWVLLKAKNDCPQEKEWPWLYKNELSVRKLAVLFWRSLDEKGSHKQAVEENDEPVTEWPSFLDILLLVFIALAESNLSSARAGAVHLSLSRPTSPVPAMQP